MIVSHRHKFIFFKTRKTAGSSLQVALAEHCGPNDIITGQYRLGIDDNSHSAGLNMNKFCSTHPHPELAQVKLFLGEEVWNSYFKFAFVRNPFDIAVSRYHWDLKGKMGVQETSVEGFQDWVKSGKLFNKDRAHLYTSTNGYVDLDFIGYYENLEEDLDYICNAIGLDTLSLPKLKSGYRDNSSYSNFYNEDTKQRVMQFYAEDFRLFRYNFENKNICKRKNILSVGDDFIENDNISTPCIIYRDNEYKMYFSNHEGSVIKLATSPALEGPWQQKCAVLSLQDTPCDTHIASPEVVVKGDKYVMYYHGDQDETQGTFIAESSNGIDFVNTTSRPVCKFYLRVFEYKGVEYGVAKDDNNGAILYNITDNFTPIANILPNARHCHALVKKDRLYLTYSTIGDSPEHIRLCTLNLGDTFEDWEVISDEALILPTYKHEGGNLPIVKTQPGSSTRRYGRPVAELRDPFMFEVNGKVHILYVTRGESSIAYARCINYFNED